MRRIDPELGAWRLTPERVLWPTAAIVLAALPHVPHSPLWVVALFGALVLWRVAGALGRMQLPGRWLRLCLAGALFVGVAATFGTPFGRAPGAALLLGLCGLKLLEMRRQRDAFVVCFLGCFLIVTHFLFSQSMASGFYMLPAALALAAALVTIGAGTRAPPPVLRLRLAGALVAQALPIALVLFVLFPRVPGPLWGLPEDAGAGLSGLDDTMSPGSLSRLGLSDAVAFRAAFEGAPPAPRRRYWRGPVLWHTDGTTWSPGATPSGAAPPPDPPAGERVDYEVTLEPHGRRWLFALELAAAVPGGAHVTDDYELVARKIVHERRRYRMRSVVGARSTHFPAARRGQALQLPDGAHPRARALAREWRAAAGGDDAALVERALRHFREQPFAYTLEPPPARDDPVDAFLFETRSGFCEHYAGAFVVLMRAAGVPARVVTGYQGGELNPLGDYLIVRQRDAHAWAEVWLDGRGWVRVDPTAAVSPARIESGMQAAIPGGLQVAGVSLAGNETLGSTYRSLRHVWDSLNNTWNQWVLGYGAERQRQLLARLGIGDARWAAFALGLASCVGVLLAAVGLWLWRRPRAQDPALRVYRRFCRKLARAGIARAPSEGPNDLERRVRRLRPHLAPEVREITRLYVRLRYGDGRARVGALERAVAAFKP